MTKAAVGVDKRFDLSRIRVSTTTACGGSSRSTVTFQSEFKTFEKAAPALVNTFGVVSILLVETINIGPFSPVA